MDIQCNFLIFGHFGNCKKCKRKRCCYAYTIWKIDITYRRAIEDIKKIKKRINKKNILTKINWAGIIREIANQADREISSYLKSSGVPNLD